MAERTQLSVQRMAQTLADQFPILLQAAAGTGRRALAEFIALCEEVLSCVDSPTRTTPDSLAQFIGARDADVMNHDETTRAIMGTESLGTLRRQADNASSQAAVALARPNLPPAVSTSNGPVHLPDLLRSLTVEAALLADHCGTTLDRAGTAQCLRAVASVLGERFPGHTIEVRVPPFAAVQLGSLTAGPVHHRGTPPNVVETDTATFWALAIGTLSWTQAREAHRLRVSGVHAPDVAQMLPIVRRR
ncbi:hypothetical protein SAMN05443377_10136 [Propionibacterium cyclohexanicum]|uniref:Bacterial SCP orthologue domain-containing protein n=2 Tax=Propionibacterium cyclohexanicum TaxID=64702 RepID=A0A1H9PI03_9ACTN|nr:hypothetical protein SAMN05443377_10136 [Propionibacterium cyclohexanicum]